MGQAKKVGVSSMCFIGILIADDFARLFLVDILGGGGCSCKLEVLVYDINIVQATKRTLPINLLPILC